MHHADDVDEESGTPEIILQRNSTKSGVDTMNKLCASTMSHVVLEDDPWLSFVVY